MSKWSDLPVWARNVIISPVVLCIRVPLALVGMGVTLLSDFLLKVNMWLPGFEQGALPRPQMQSLARVCLVVAFCLLLVLFYLIYKLYAAAVSDPVLLLLAATGLIVTGFAMGGFYSLVKVKS